MDAEHQAKPIAPTIRRLLLVCVHGFKGTDASFENFPERLAYTLSHTFVDRIHVEPVVFPTYRTAGDFKDAVGEREAALAADEPTKGSSKGACGIILMGHSMGGLVSADTTLNIAGAFEGSQAVLWPRVLGVLSFDTPWLGVHPAVFANTADQAITYGSQATQVASVVGSAFGLWGANKKAAAPPAPASSAAKSGSAVAAQAAAGKSGWMGMMPVVAGGAAVAAAAGAALWHRKALSQFAWLGWDGVSSHLQFVGELWKTEALRNRLDRIVALDDNGGHNRVGFHCLYTTMPSQVHTAPPRTFIVLPPKTSKALPHFEPNHNSNAANEVDAHVSCFSTKSTGNHELAQRSIQLITTWIEESGSAPSAPVKN